MSLAVSLSASSRRAICRSCIASSSRHTLLHPPPLLPRPIHSTPTSLVREEFDISPGREPEPALPIDRRPPINREPDGYTTIGTLNEGNREIPLDEHGQPKRQQAPVIRTKPLSTDLNASGYLPPLPPTPLQIAQRILIRLPEFASSQRFNYKLSDYGLLSSEAKDSVRAWTRSIDDLFERCENDVEAREAFEKGGFQLDRLIQSFTNSESDESSQAAVEHSLTRNYAQFASAHSSVSPQTQRHLQSILTLTDLTNIAFSQSFLQARAIRRHFHLHIGPTNSGKTYNALKALAGANKGAYAGPLRLLAHEVWERLNLGTVGGLDGKSKKCNLLTGEEHRIVDPHTQLLSCTVEMIPLAGSEKEPYDVVVIDEIQMLKDSARGGAWSRALLGVQAKEIHLCGDETTLNLLSTLIPSLGDTMEVHRYDRLTPLTVGDSLQGDLDNVEKGDCVVTFSRSNIFSVKKQIEQKTSRKCAVVYGALPPETRAEQARNFNDENAHEEILVASDAVGMGLNLKIKRLVFESLTKFNGRQEVPLSLTQIKQIAGRAGRYGMGPKQPEADDKLFNNGQESSSDRNDFIGIDDKPDAGGIVTTLHEQDLPLLRELLPIPLPPASQMIVDIPNEIMQQLATLLPPDTKFSELQDHIKSLCIVPPNMSTGSVEVGRTQAEILDQYSRHLSLQELNIFQNAPINLRDPSLKYIFSEIIRAYTHKGLVELEEVLQKSRFISILDLCEATLAILPPLPPIIGIGRGVLTPPIIVSSIPALEGLHRSLVLYMWLSFRLPIAFPERTKAAELKARCEVVLEDCLERMPGLRNKKTQERTKEGDGAVAVWRKKYVAPNGTRKFAGSDKKGVLWVQEAVAQRLKNKNVWKSTGVVPQDKWLNEVDGRGAGEAPPPPVIPGGFRTNYMINTPRSRHAPDNKAHSGWWPAAAPGRAPDTLDGRRERYDD